MSSAHFFFRYNNQPRDHPKETDSESLKPWGEAPEKWAAELGAAVEGASCKKFGCA